MSLSRLAIAAVLAAGALAAAGCGKEGLEAGKAEQRIKDGIEVQGRTKVKSVECPNNIQQQKGRVFNCNVTFSEGKRSTLSVTQTDDDGSLAWNLTIPAGAPEAGGATGATGATPANGGAGARAGGEAETGPPEIKGYKRFRSRRWGYSVEYPNDWKQSGPEGNVVFGTKGGYFTHVFVSRSRPATVREVRDALEDRPETTGTPRVTKRSIGRYQAVQASYSQRTQRGVRVEVQRYVFSRAGKQAALDLVAPGGISELRAAYDRIARSFRWE